VRDAGQRVRPLVALGRVDVDARRNRRRSRGCGLSIGPEARDGFADRDWLGRVAEERQPDADAGDREDADDPSRDDPGPSHARERIAASDSEKPG
jgi:hypothetical protein